MQALRRFSSYKSLPKVLISDNVSTYMAAAAAAETVQLNIVNRDYKQKGCYMEVYSKMCPLVKGSLGTSHWIDQDYTEQGTRVNLWNSIFTADHNCRSNV